MKRTLDLILSISGLIVFFPVFFLVALFVLFDVGSPILFKQTRIGKNGKPFDILKFRTMRNDKSLNGEPLPDSMRITAIGRTLRAASLDELPGLWNVIVGNMSLVGPRPLLVEYLPLYTDLQNRRHEVQPGITGWAQVNGRNLLSWEAKFDYDVWYVDNRSFALDIKILFMTIKKVITSDGINTSDDSSMPRFTGSSKISKDD